VTSPVAATADELYLQVYQSPLVNASRMGKIGRSMQATGLFRETHLVGVQAADLPPVEDIADRVRIVRVRGSGRRGNLGRVLRLLMWQPRVFLQYRRQRVALIAAHNVWVLPLCYLLSRSTGATLTYNAHELETETIAMSGVKQRVAKLIESRLIRRCALVSVVNGSIADWYASAYGIPRPIVVGNIPVVVDAEVGFRDRLGIRGDEMMYLHTGHLSGGRNIPLILATFAGSPHHVVFMGDGAYRAAVVEAAGQHPTIHWAPPVEPDLIVAHVREADVALCLIEAQALSLRLSSPNKLSEALAADVPALCSDLPHARAVLGDLADTWVLDDPERDLAGAVSTITKADCATFRDGWSGLPSWDEEVEPLTTAVAQVLAGGGER
jgi:glycosyltransferase involved in cell wall biosynthesis